MYQAGTLSANPVAMTAGMVTLTKLQDKNVYRSLAELGAYLKRQLHGFGGLAVQQLGSLFWLVPDGKQAGTIRTRADIPPTVSETYPPLFHRALRDGLYLPPSPFECGFLSTAHTTEHVDRLRENLLTDG
jgi:glutamate-1-semialdehyde 2,1-aminomutase